MHASDLRQPTALAPAFPAGSHGQLRDEDVGIHGVVNHAPGSGLIRRQGGQIKDEHPLFNQAQQPPLLALLDNSTRCRTRARDDRRLALGRAKRGRRRSSATVTLDCAPKQVGLPTDGLRMLRLLSPAADMPPTRGCAAVGQVRTPRTTFKRYAQGVALFSERHWSKLARVTPCRPSVARNAGLSFQPLTRTALLVRW
jgi:hypothetical protein